MDLTFSLAEARVHPTMSGTSTCSTPLLTRTVMRAFSFTLFRRHRRLVHYMAPLGYLVAVNIHKFDAEVTVCPCRPLSLPASCYRVGQLHILCHTKQRELPRGKEHYKMETRDASATTPVHTAT